MQLSSDPDARIVRWVWIAWIVVTLVLALRGLTFEGDQLTRALRWATLVPMLALWLLWPLVRGWAALWRWMRAAPHVAWNGSYFEFDGRQMRILFDDDEVFVVADDVFDALGLHGHATHPERVRQLAGREGLRQLPPRREFLFSERGLAAWLERRTEKDAVRFRRWFESQVLAPHRKRREIQTGAVRSNS